MKPRWEITVELTFDIDPEDMAIKHEGDAPVDFSRRAFERVRPAVQDLIDQGPFAHFRVAILPKEVWD